MMTTIAHLYYEKNWFQADGFRVHIDYRGIWIPCLLWRTTGIEVADRGIILGMGAENERRRYILTSFLTGWAHTQKETSDPS